MSSQSKSLAPHTGQVFEAVSKLECIKPFTLVGGTALSLQIEKRQSEDLDFMKWQQKKNEKCEYAPPRKSVKSMQRIPFLNNLYLADMESIGAMKMEAR